MLSSKNKITGALVALTLVSLAGCSSPHPHTSDLVTASPEASAVAASPAATATTSPVPAPSVGATLDATAAAALPDGWKVYPMADGTKVAVSTTAPLPEPVRAQAIAPIAATVQGLPHGPSTTQAQMDAVGTIEATVDRAAYTISQATGKHAVIIFSFYGAVRAFGSKPGMIWESSARGAIDTVATPIRDAAVSATQAWIAKQSNPGSYELFVIE